MSQDDGRYKIGAKRTTQVEPPGAEAVLHRARSEEMVPKRDRSDIRSELADVR